MTVNEFMEWLATQDQGATIEVIKILEGPVYCPRDPSVVTFDPDQHAEYFDMRDNPFAKDKPYAESRTLLIGEM
jgi:hypothetical protein